MKFPLALVVVLVVIDCRQAAAQSANSLLNGNASTDSALLFSDPVFAELDSILHSDDSLSVLGLIDSLLALTEARSELGLRLGYNSNITASTNTVDIEKFGLSPGIAYYHKSGAYADVGAYWSDEYNPKLYLTVTSLGYMLFPTAHWSILGEYSHYFYNTPDSIESAGVATYVPYSDRLYLSNFIQSGVVTFRLDYAFLFGQETGNRIYPAIGLDLKKENWLGVDRIRFFPSAGLLFGNMLVTTYVPNWTRPLEYFLLIRQGKPVYSEVVDKPWGIMNYSLSAPVSISLANWTFLASYTYNFPQSLPGEMLDISHSGYITISVNRYFKL